MNKAFLTIVVTGATAARVVEELNDADLGHVQVLAQGDIQISDKELAPLTNTIWLHEPEVLSKATRMRVVADSDTGAGRWASAEELEVLKEYGVCVEVQIAYSSGIPRFAVHKAAIQAEVSNYGFKVAPDAQFDSSITEVDGLTIESGIEKRWFRIAMPTWFNLAA